MLFRPLYFLYFLINDLFINLFGLQNDQLVMDLVNERENFARVLNSVQGFGIIMVGVVFLGLIKLVGSTNWILSSLKVAIFGVKTLNIPPLVKYSWLLFQLFIVTGSLFSPFLLGITLLVLFYNMFILLRSISEYFQFR